MPLLFFPILRRGKMLRRNRKVTFRLNDAEYNAFKRHVRQSGLSQEGYLRLLLSGHTPKEQPPIEYHKLLRELYAIGNNLNQIAARANATGFFLAGEYARNADALRQAILKIQAACTLPV